MKRYYISGRITGLPESESDRNFQLAKVEVSKMGFEPLSPKDLPHNHDQSWESFMKEDLIQLVKCDGVYALKDWRMSKGASIEVNLALVLGLNVIYQ